MAENTDQAQQFPFKAEVQRVLSLVINSLYDKPEVFLRELVSNASDALDKARFLQLTEADAVTASDAEHAIDILLDPAKSTLIVEDNGVGMTREEVIDNLGTVARSGTTEFLARLGEAQKRRDREDALELIGQFGVGFYAVFMVASRVEVDTLSMQKGAEPILWRSTGEGEFTVLPGERKTPGTRVTLHLKADASEFAEKWRIAQIIEKYSNFVMFPIRVDGEVANQSSALWRLARAKVGQDQHAELFKLIAGASEAPLATIHWSVDAPVQFHALLYLPQKAPAELWQPRAQQGLRLYAKRVLVMERCDKLLPPYLRFLRGVVDSEDVQLNVSRESLQENRTIKQIEQQLTRQALKALQAMAQDEPDKYADFWGQFGVVLKEGLATDFKHKAELAKLCRFESLRKGGGSSHKGALIGLSQYLKEKPEAQQEIFYLTGVDRARLARSPHLEAFASRGIDVLLLTDPIDEWVVQALPEVEGHKLVSVAHGEIDLDAIAKPAEAAAPADDELTRAAIAALEKILGDRVQSVRASKRLTDSAACLVARAGDPGANLERLMSAFDGAEVQVKKRFLEINPRHAIVRNLGALAQRDPAAARLALYGETLHDLALLAEGTIDDPAGLVRRVEQLLLDATAAAK